jgi:demethylmenaquinone methyltransferase/2-methoxy-6-polyprenyl-1,4-benzoquinol methylase
MNTGSIHPAAQIRSFFSSIAPRYDLANHLLSGGCDYLWRWRAAREIAAGSPKQILDLATGSGDLALLLRKHCPESLVVGADFCFPMLQTARRKGVPALVGADGLHLPFAAASFDAATVAFGLRNMASWPEVLAELARVLRPAGRLLILDFSLPTGLFGKVYQTYLHRVLPRLARLVTGQSAAYEYLGDSIERFPQGDAMDAILREAGFDGLRQIRLNGGIVTIYIGSKKEGDC